MRTLLLIAVGLAALLPVWPVSLAAEPDDPAEKGRVLLLVNERVLEGEIERVGNQYRVRRPVGETWVPAGSVMQLCPDLESALRLLRTRANLRDPDERLRLARWCHLYGLKPQAIEEVQAAVKLRPDHSASRRLLDHLQQSAAQGEPAEAPPPPAPEAPAPTVPPVDLSAEAIAQFCTRIQPILMNACANCHATGRGGAFKLTRVYDERSLSRKTVQYNLTAVLSQVNPQRPLGSALLTKAVTAHGELTQAPLKGRQATPYRTLEDWVRRTLASNPQLQEEAKASDGGPAAEPAFAENRPTATPSVSAPPIEAKPATEPQTPQPVDPFDPVQFNRQMHPERKPDQPKP